jgi:hypothetical protein
MAKEKVDKLVLADRLGVRLTKIIEMTEHCLLIQDEALRAKDICNELKGVLIKESK